MSELPKKSILWHLESSLVVTGVSVIVSLIEHECVRSVSKQVSQPSSFIACSWWMCRVPLIRRTPLMEIAGSGAQNTDMELKVLNSVVWAKDWLCDHGASWLTHKVKWSYLQWVESSSEKDATWLLTKCLLSLLTSDKENSYNCCQKF